MAEISHSGSRTTSSILLVVEPGLDGVFRHVEGLTHFLLKQGVRVHLAYSSRRCGIAMLALVDKVRKSGGEVLDMRIGNVPELADTIALFRLIRLIRRTHPDILHAHSSKAGALGRFAALLLCHRRCFYSPHAYFGMTKPRSLRVMIYNWIERLLGKFGTTIAISGDEARFAHSVLHVPESRIRIIHNSVDTGRFVPASSEQKQVARLALGIPENAVVLAIIGRMCWQKNPETAYAGVAPVCAQNPDLLLLHLGWGKWKSYLQSLGQSLGMGEQLRIVDYTNDPREFYHAIDALIVSSRYEAGWPLVFLEALACNLPAVAATCTGMSEVGRAPLSHVWTFPPEQVEACTAAVAQWLVSQRNGVHDCNHRRFAIDRLSPERSHGALYNLYVDNGVHAVVAPIEEISESK